MTAVAGEQNPFLRYRTRLDSYAQAAAAGIGDTEFVELVGGLDAQVAQVWGSGFAVSPIVDGAPIVERESLTVDLSIKVDVHNVGGSHKSRHLFGALLAQRVAELTGAPPAERFAIASCGNAALGAAVVARAVERPIDVFVPTWADESVVADLNALGANITRCERRPNESGDPCYLRFREAVEAGASPFSVQGTDTPTTFDGGRTLGWEIAEQLGDRPPDSLYIQVGGGALATSVSAALPAARLHPVQAEGCAPLRRAWDRLGDHELDDDALNAGGFMEPWDDPQSFASGILDDVTYDWVPLLRQTRASGGHPIVATEAAIERAYAVAHELTDVPVCSTGTAGLAGLLTEAPPRREHVVVLFTGIDRS